MKTNDVLDEYMCHESYKLKIKMAFNSAALSGRREQFIGLALRYKLDGQGLAAMNAVDNIDMQQEVHDQSLNKAFSDERTRQTAKSYFTPVDTDEFKSRMNSMSDEELEIAAKRSDESRNAAYGLEGIMSVVNRYNSTIIQEREMALLKEYGNAEYKDSAHADAVHRLSVIRSDLDELVRSAGYIDNKGQFDKDALAENIMKANISSELAYDVADYTADIFNDNRSEDQFVEEEGFDYE